MSEKEARRFAEDFEKNPSLRESVTKGWEHIVNVGKNAGYDFTAEELHNHLVDKWGAKNIKKTHEGAEAASCFSEAPGS
jgi:predicted ribosomally synthesized peptide with nif11-like leader